MGSGMSSASAAAAAAAGGKTQERSAEKRCRERERRMKACVKAEHAYAAAHAAYLRSLKDTGAALRQFGDLAAEDMATMSSTTAAATASSSSSSSSSALVLCKLQRNPSSSSSASAASSASSSRKTLPFFPPPFPHFLFSTPSSASTPPTFKLHSPASHKMHSLAKSFLPSLPRKLTFSESDTAVDSPPHHAHAHAPPPPPPPPLPPIPVSSSSSSLQWEFDLYSNAFPPRHASSISHSKLEHEEDPDQGAMTPVKGDMDLPRCEFEDCTSRGGADPARWRSSSSPPPPPHSIDGNHKALDKFLSPEDHALARMLKQLDDCFLLAFESGRHVARLLQGQRTHYHHNPAGATGSLKHSSRVHRVMSWGRYMHDDGEYALTNGEKDDETCSNEKETHASTLDKLLAWEKKLHEEVKVGENLRIQLEKKSMQLKKQKKREEGSAMINKTKASVKSLHTRYLVEIQAVDAASNEVEKLRDNFLHSQLLELAKQSMRMWKIMLNCHQQQFQLLEDLKLDALCTPAKTTEVQVKNTLQLEAEFEIWQRNLENLVTTQNAYLNSMCEWLILHIIEIESDGKQGPVYPSSSLVYELAKAWFDALKHVNGNASLRAMKEFSNRIHELKIQQTEEIKQKKRVDQLKKQLEKKEHALKVHMMKHDEKQSEDGINTTGSSTTKAIEASVKLLKERVDFEKDEYEKMCVKSGNMTLVILQKGLPPVLKSMKDFANNFFQHYTNLFFLKMPVGDQKQSAPSSMLQITL